MGKLGDEENPSNKKSEKKKVNVDFIHDDDTQIIDGDEADDFLCLTETMPVDDTFMLEDAYETQLVNLAGETQVMDFGDETQVLDDFDCGRNLPAELFNECNADIGTVSDSEGSNNTEVLCDTEKVSQDEHGDIDGLFGHKNEVDSRPRKQDDHVPYDIFSKKGHHSGSVCRGFTAVRSAAIRASGLAARLRRSNGNSCSIGNDKSSLEQQTHERAGSSLVGGMPESSLRNNDMCTWNMYNEDQDELRNSNSCKVGVPTVRKLFLENEVAEVVKSETDKNHKDDNSDMHEFSEDCIAGLSYANSQVPGELSQAHALEVVDNFLEQNLMENVEGFGSRINIAEEPKVVSGAKGSRDLAKSSNLKSTVGLAGVYDWDDTREDEGGGDFSLKKKEVYFDKGRLKERPLTEPRKRKCSSLRSIKSVGHHGDEEQTYYKKKLRDSVDLDKDELVSKNLGKEFNEELNSSSAVSDNDTSKDIPDIGPDTQVALEAMETLCFEVHLTDSNGNGPKKGAGDTTKAAVMNQSSRRGAHLEQSSMQKTQCSASIGVVTRRAKQAKTNGADTNKESSLLQSKNSKKQCDTDIMETEKRVLSDSNDDVVSYGKELPSRPSEIDKQKKRRAGKRSSIHDIDPSHGTKSTGRISEKKSCLQEQLGFVVPVAKRTRKFTELNISKAADKSVDARENMNDLINAPVLRKKRTAAKGKNVQIITIEKLRKLRSTGLKQSNAKYGSASSASNLEALDDLKGKRTREEKLIVEEEADKHCDMRLKRSRTIAASSISNPGRIRTNHSSTFVSPALPSLDQQTLLQQTVGNERSRNYAAHSDVSKQFDAESLKSAEGSETNGRVEESPRGRSGKSRSTCTPPATYEIPVNDASPICMGDEYLWQSCRKNLSKFSRAKEINNLIIGSVEPFSGTIKTRQRRDITNIQVLFSQHLDEDVIKQQKKILARLGAGAASSISDATHFVADEFVRTRNMLEAIAFGKPVVTHLWLESCGLASCLIDEKTYILRDVRKEKEFGFSMPVSLSRACQHPLLQGQKVLVTPNTKPGKDILVDLVKAVHGLAVERLGRSVLKDEKLPDDLLILSCEEDYEVCVPFLEKGGAVYSSELLLNGIVKQKLEYERHRLFADHVKKTRSTIWVKKKNRYLPVSKCT